MATDISALLGVAYGATGWDDELKTALIALRDAVDLAAAPQIVRTATGTSADRTSTIQAAIDSLAGTDMSQNLQGSGGTWQGGAAALGGGKVVLGPGTYWVSNLIGDHRVELDLSAGAVLKRIPGVTGHLVANKRTGTRHAQYFTVRGGLLDGNKTADSALCGGVLLQGDEANNYTSTLDEDYDINCRLIDTTIRDFRGDGLKMHGGGGNKIRGVVAERNDGIGFNLAVGPSGTVGGQDNQINGCHVSWSGLEGVLVDGESVTMVDVKSWYSGAVTAARGYGFKITADSGSYGILNAQDNRAAGILLDGAFSVSIAGALLDSNSRGSAGTYPALDIFGSSYNPIAGVAARNRYNAAYNGTTNVGEQASAVRVRNGSVGNTVDMTAAVGVWGQSNTFVQSGSTLTGNSVRVNGVTQ